MECGYLLHASFIIPNSATFTGFTLNVKILRKISATELLIFKN